MEKDIRWQQRYHNLKKAYTLLNSALKKKKLSDLEKEGVIQRFEYTFELAWKTLKDFLESQGFKEIIGAKDVIRLAFQNEIISDGDIWFDMISGRNLTSHLYDEKVAEEIMIKIRTQFFPCFSELVAFLDNVNQA